MTAQFNNVVRRDGATIEAGGVAAMEVLARDLNETRRGHSSIYRTAASL
jgi:hypothetical protein